MSITVLRTTVIEVPNHDSVQTKKTETNASAFKNVLGDAVSDETPCHFAASSRHLHGAITLGVTPGSDEADQGR